MQNTPLNYICDRQIPIYSEIKNDTFMNKCVSKTHLLVVLLAHVGWGQLKLYVQHPVLFRPPDIRKQETRQLMRLAKVTRNYYCPNHVIVVKLLRTPIIHFLLMFAHLIGKRDFFGAS